ncbi:dipeptide epimerase [Enterobacter sp. AD2-3]|uniref:dipeptide epimerase n=1 Tax=Enterobacter sp. AD2-3 TaxID=2547834 RepID=UPI00109E194F|nr:dipeptide epimerase [Enterobacter sp. AD2-3]THC25513.1 dipeptide epimerase [Enterobacter sp. AD2-3]
MELNFYKHNLILREPFVSHKSVTDSGIEHVIVRLKWKNYEGVGVAVPAKEYGETAETISMVLEQYRPGLQHSTPFERITVLENLQTLLPGHPAALSAIDIALHDLLGKRLEQPIHRLLGLAGKALPPTAISLGLMSNENTVSSLEKLCDWPVIKLKMSRPDESRLKLVREHYRGRIWIDGNGAWNLKEAMKTLDRFERYGVELIEQPIAAGFPEHLKFLRERTSLQVIADEDCHSCKDIRRLSDCVDGVNIKLLKCGGLSNATKMITLAHDVGMSVMLGCKTESSIGITAMAQIGGLADYLDLDGHLDIENDIFEGLKIVKGELQLPCAPGLGLTLKGNESIPHGSCSV